MFDQGSLFKNQVMMLAQTFFIKDNRDELLLCAHKYDFDFLFFDQVSDFIMAAQAESGDTLFVIDLDVLHNLQEHMKHSRRQTLNLVELLQQLPGNHSYVYLQTAKQGERYLLQQNLVDSNCRAYAEKPIPNDVFVDKLFTLFKRHKRGETNALVYLGALPPFDMPALERHSIEFWHHTDYRNLHQKVKELQPDVVVIEDDEFIHAESVVRVLKKNIEADPSREIIMLQKRIDPALTQRALEAGFDDVIVTQGVEILTQQIANHVDRIRVAKDLIGRDRATGLLNKIGLQKKAQEMIRRAAREQVTVAYGVIDIDKFKSINDTWGHYFGDIVIKRLSLVLSAMIGPRDLLSRFGGEEFVVLFWDSRLEEGRDKLDAMRKTFCAISFEVAPGDQRHFSFSGGMASYPSEQTETELFLQADAMLYHAKEGGRNQIRMAG